MNHIKTSHTSLSFRIVVLFLFLISFLISGNQVSATGTTYYVSASGSDSNNGITPATPWKTSAKVNSAGLNPGDQVLFNRGDTFANTALVVNHSGAAGSPITFGAYGIGANPILDGGGSTKAILSISNQAYITINDLVFQNATSLSGGIFLFQDHDITIHNNFFTKVATGVYAASCSDNIVFDSNDALNMMGPLPRGQMIQLDGVSGSGIAITNNKVQEIMGQSDPEDEINLYQSNGTSSSPIMVSGNQIEGGGPSHTGGGIMLGDGGGSYETASNNILVNPGQYGMAVASGTNMTISNNKIYAAKNTFTNVGLYAWNQSTSTCSAVTISNNQINWTSSSGEANSTWDGGNCGTITGWSTNATNTSLSSALLPNPLWTTSVVPVPSVAVDTGTTAPSDTTAPTVSLTSPIAKTTISGISTLTATASDAVGVTKVEFYYNTVLIGTATTYPYTFNWNTVPYNNGIYLLHAKAYDAAGNTTTSASVPVTISNTAVVVTPPVITPPSSGGGGGGSFTPTPVIITPSEPINPTTNTPPTIPTTQNGIDGCLPGYLFSTTTGQSCSGTITPINQTSFTINPNATITSPYNFGLLTLRNGTHNNYVKELQRFLNATLNLGLVVDGKFGPKTAAVVEAWQTAHGLTVDGLVGYKTKLLMNGTVLSHS